MESLFLNDMVRKVFKSVYEMRARFSMLLFWTQIISCMKDGRAGIPDRRGAWGHVPSSIQVIMFLSLTRTIERWEAGYRKNVEFRYGSWYREKPKRYRIELDARKCKLKVVVSLASFPTRSHLEHDAFESFLKRSLKSIRVGLRLGEDKVHSEENDLTKELLELREMGLENRWFKDLKSTA